MAVTWPDAITNTDELSYVAAATDYAQGRSTGVAIDPTTLLPYDRINSLYPAGTSLAQAPWVAVFGWRGAYVVPLAGFLGALWAMYALLRSVGLNPWFALVLPAFPATTVLARCATSDSWNLFLVTVALAMFAHGVNGPKWRWSLSGFAAGLVLATREASVLVLAPIMLVAVVRREPGWWALVAGGALGAGVRLVSAWIIFDNPLFRHPGYGVFTLHWLLRNFPFYLGITLVLIPAGLVALVRYRGWRWRELTIGAAALLLLHAAYQYGAGESGGPNAVVIGGRYVMPALPVFALALAWLVRPQEAGAATGLAGRWQRWREIVDRRVPAVFTVVALATVAIHPLSWWWSRAHAGLAADICTHVPPGARAIVSGPTLVKALGPWHCQRAWVPAGQPSAQQANKWATESTPLYVVNGVRADSAAYRAGSAAFVQWLDARIAPERRQVVYRASRGVVQLEISRILPPRPSAPPDAPRRP